MKNCTACGKPLADDAAFCRFCGARAVTTGGLHVCPVCGRQAAPGTAYCIGCGAELGRLAPAEPTPADSTPAAMPNPTPAAPAPAGMSVRRCPRCGRPLPAGTSSCAYCAASRAAGTGTKRRSGKGWLVVAAALGLCVLIGVISAAVESGHTRAAAGGYSGSAGYSGGSGGYAAPYVLPGSGDTDGSGAAVQTRNICPVCHGSTSCPICHGTGRYSIYGQSGPCTACDGTGDCYECGGTGYVN